MPGSPHNLGTHSWANRTRMRAGTAVLLRWRSATQQVVCDSCTSLPFSQATPVPRAMPASMPQAADPGLLARGCCSLWHTRQPESFSRRPGLGADHTRWEVNHGPCNRAPVPAMVPAMSVQQQPLVVSTRCQAPPGWLPCQSVWPVTTVAPAGDMPAAAAGTTPNCHASYAAPAFALNMSPLRRPCTAHVH